MSRAEWPRACPTPSSLLICLASCHPRGAWLPGCPGEQPTSPTQHSHPGASVAFVAVWKSLARGWENECRLFIWALRPLPRAAKPPAVCPPGCCQVSPGALHRGGPQGDVETQETPVISCTAPFTPLASGSPLFAARRVQHWHHGPNSSPSSEVTQRLGGANPAEVNTGPPPPPARLATARECPEHLTQVRVTGEKPSQWGASDLGPKAAPGSQGSAGPGERGPPGLPPAQSRGRRAAAQEAAI